MAYKYFRYHSTLLYNDCAIGKPAPHRVQRGDLPPDGAVGAGQVAGQGGREGGHVQGGEGSHQAWKGQRKDWEGSTQGLYIKINIRIRKNVTRVIKINKYRKDRQKDLKDQSE